MRSIINRILNPVRRVHANDDRDDHSNEKIEFSRKHLRRLVCENSCFNKRVVFGAIEVENGSMAKNKILSDGSSVIYYEWPKDRIHSKARDTHSHLNLRLPVPNGKVLWTIPWASNVEYRPNFAVGNDEIEYSTPIIEARNPCGRYDN